MKKSTLLQFLLLPLFLVTLLVSHNYVDFIETPKQNFLIAYTILVYLAVTLVRVFAKKEFIIKLNRIDLAFITYVLYILIRYLAFQQVRPLEQEFYLFLTFIAIYFLFKAAFNSGNSKHIVNLALLTLMLVGIIQIGYGFLQLAGVKPNLMELFKLGGSFGNPGPYAIYLSTILPFALYVVWLKPGNKLETVLRMLCWLYVLGYLVLIPFSQSRTAWIMAIVAITLVTDIKLGMSNKLFTRLKNLWLRIALISGLVVLIMFVGVQLYKFKQDSSSGRLFIWQNTIEIIQENPVFGVGFNTFPVEYNKVQANYCKTHPENNKYFYLADNVSYAFNEFLEIWAELGIIGLILFLVFVYFVLIARTRDTTEFDDLFKIMKLIVALVFLAGLFSYPLHSLPVKLNFIFAIAYISANANKLVFNKKLTRTSSRFLFITLVVLLVIILQQQLNRRSALREWKIALEQMHKGEVEQAIRGYKKAYPVLKYSGRFLYNYGAELSVNQRFKESEEILLEAEPKLNDADFYNYLGNTYEGLGELQKAEEAYLQSSSIIPHKLYPKYRLVFIYSRTNRIDEATELAMEIIHFKPKIESQTTNSIKQDMVQLLEELKDQETAGESR